MMAFYRQQVIEPAVFCAIFIFIFFHFFSFSEKTVDNHCIT